MPVSFLNPWFWLGALALGAPVWLHLRRKQQTGIVPFSAVRFLNDQPEPRRSPLQLRRRLLFAARALALLLIVAGFAWPYMRRTNFGATQESRVYILDNTLSHQALDGFTRDRDWLVSELSKASPAAQLAVVELTGAPRLVSSFSDSRETAREKVAELKPSHQRGSYLAAFRYANSLLKTAVGRQKRIVVLGDNQENQWNENVGTPPFLADIKVDLPRSLNRSLPNLSLSEPRAQRVFTGDKSMVQFSVKLSHIGPAKRARVLVRADGQEVVNRDVDLEKQPGTLLLQAHWETDMTNWLKGDAVIEGEPDSLAADNRVFFSVAPVTEGKVALLAQSPYLRVALSPEIMRGRWSTELLDPARLGDTEVARADVLCLESSCLQSAEVRKLLHTRLANGDGVLLVVNRLSPAIEGCLRELGFEAAGMARPGEQSPDGFRFILFNHPVLHPFSSPDFGNLQEIRIFEFARLKSSAATPLVFGQGGEELLFQSSNLRGKLLVIAFGLDREHTSWPIHPSFIPFIDLCLQGTRTQDPTPGTFEPGELARIAIPKDNKSSTFVLESGKREVARGSLTQGHLAIRLPDEPGAYELRADGSQQVERVLCVNPSAKESQLVYNGSPETLKRWRNAPSGGQAGSSLATVAGELRVSELLQQRLWWWMLLGGLLVLMLEMSLADASKEER